MAAAQYDQLWDSIKRSPFGSTYLDELYALAKQVVTPAEDVFRAAPKPAEPANRLQIDHDIMRNLFTLLGSAARINALIGDRPQQRWQTEQDYEIQRRRTEWLRIGILKGKVVSPSLGKGSQHIGTLRRVHRWGRHRLRDQQDADTFPSAD